jgi:hypothetical protein
MTQWQLNLVPKNTIAMHEALKTFNPGANVTTFEVTTTTPAL